MSPTDTRLRDAFQKDLEAVLQQPDRRPMMDALRTVLDPWLGKPKRKQTEGRVAFIDRFDSEDVPSLPLRLKVETNTRNRFARTAFSASSAVSPAA